MRKLVVGISAIVGLVALAGCGSDTKDSDAKSVNSAAPTTSTFPLPTEDLALARRRIRAEQSSVLNALSTLKLQLVDAGEYSDDYDLLREMEPTIDWGTSVTVVVSDDKQSVCVEGPDHGPNAYAAASVTGTDGPETYYGILGCPADLDMNSVDAPMSTTPWGRE